MAFAATTLDQFLIAVRARIIASSGVFSADNCLIALSRPEPSEFNPGTITSLTCLVYPGPGQFVSEVMTGGGTAQLHWRGILTVEVISPIKLDQPGRDAEFLTNSTLGVIKGITGVLKALAIHDPVVSTNTTGIDPLFPQDTSQPIRDEGNFGSLAINFEASFKWSIS